MLAIALQVHLWFTMYACFLCLFTILFWFLSCCCQKALCWIFFEKGTDLFYCSIWKKAYGTAVDCMKRRLFYNGNDYSKRIYLPYKHKRQTTEIWYDFEISHWICLFYEDNIKQKKTYYENSNVIFLYKRNTTLINMLFFIFNDFINKK